MRFPEGFEKRMKELLGEEAEAFLASCDRPRRRGLRVNTARTGAERFPAEAPFKLERIPWTENGFYYPETERPARHPFYAAGLYYLQEPSAMAPAALLPLRPGERVLDLCAAPGGKATELAARLAVLDRTSGSASARPGILYANEYVPARAKALLRNLEMAGARNSCVLNERPDRLAGAFPEYFDKILADAPCSGEGMFRREEDARKLWSEERVEACARTQKEILEQAYRMLRPGGQLLYSTCTFAPEEDEEQAAAFLQAHPDMTVEETARYPGFSGGLPGHGLSEEEARRCVRIWPHRAEGEGHFAVLFRKAGGPAAAGRYGPGRELEREERRAPGRARGQAGKRGKTPASAARPDREQRRLLTAFLRQTAGLTETGAEELAGRVTVRQGRAFLPAAPEEQLAGLHVIRNGLYLGDWKTKRFEPSQAFALALDAGPAAAADLPADDPRVGQYLRGEPVEIGGLPAESAVRSAAGEDSGWRLVCADGHPLGWAKQTGSILKNKYPAGWRRTGDRQGCFVRTADEN